MNHPLIEAPLLAIALGAVAATLAFLLVLAADYFFGLDKTNHD